MHVRFMSLHSSLRIKRVVPITQRGIKRGKEGRAVYSARNRYCLMSSFSRAIHHSFGLFYSNLTSIRGLTRYNGAKVMRAHIYFSQI